MWGVGSILGNLFTQVLTAALALGHNCTPVSFRFSLKEGYFYHKEEMDTQRQILMSQPRVDTV